MGNTAGNSVIGKKVRWHAPRGLVWEGLLGPDTIEYTVVEGDRRGRHAVQQLHYHRVAPGIEQTAWYEESGAIVHITWYWESRTTHRLAAVPAWLANDFTVTVGDNQDPEFREKIQRLAQEGPDAPRRISWDLGYFEVL